MSSKITAPVPPGDEMRAAMARVWAIYEGDYDEIQVEIRERLATHPAFGPLIRDTRSTRPRTPPASACAGR